MSPTQQRQEVAPQGFPRPRGDEPLTAEDRQAALKFSPPARG